MVSPKDLGGPEASQVFKNLAKEELGAWGSSFLLIASEKFMDVLLLLWLVRASSCWLSIPVHFFFCNYLQCWEKELCKKIILSLLRLLLRYQAKQSRLCVCF